MKQVLYDPKSRQVLVEEVPPPVLKPDGVLVSNAFSAISPGTERTAVGFGRRSLLGKVKDRPDLVKRVLVKMQNEGLVSTLQMVRARLGSSTALGYSSAGTVVAVGQNVQEFKIGDRVACAGGGYACHAEIIFVPKNLSVHVPDGVSLDKASLAALGAVAMQGLRLAEPTFGENIAVIGLGLLGLLTLQLARAAGCRVLGIDVDPGRARLASELGAECVALRGKDDVVSLAHAFTRGYGIDACIITAATPTNDPVELSGEISRDRGRVVAVGLVGLNIPRRPYYEKELEFRVSRSYGPGRYDTQYEEKGIDYPIGYVRWTEKRNMEEFLREVEVGKVGLDRLISHRIPVEDAPRAYQIIEGKTDEPYLGVLLTYPQIEVLSSKVHILPERVAPSLAGGRPRGTLGIIGAGNFGRTVLLPALKALPGVKLCGVATATGLTAKEAAKRFGIAYATSDYHDLLADPEIDSVVIATRHNLHAKLVIETLRAGKNVFVEKPLAISLPELVEVVKAQQASQKLVMVGFNRRFAPLAREAKEFFNGRGPLIVKYRINAGFIPPTSWVRDPEEGGNRIVGEVCHFVDWAQYLVGAPPVSVYAQALGGEGIDSDNVVAVFRHGDGSLASISYMANGDKSLPKERIEVFGSGSVCIIDDFVSADFARGGRRKKKGALNQDKGHREELRAFIRAVTSEAPSPVPFTEAVLSTLATFAIMESIRAGQPQPIDLTQAGLTEK